MSTITLNRDTTATIINTDDIRFNIVAIGDLSNVNTTTGLAEGVLLKYDDTNNEFVVTDEIDGGTY